MSPYKILVVEDNPITRKMPRATPASAGYAVLEAPDGWSAIDLVVRESPDLVLQGILLPDLDGETNRERARALGAVAFLQKPADNNELLAAIAQGLAG